MFAFTSLQKDDFSGAGNTSNEALRDLLKKTSPQAMDLIGKGDKLVEISRKA